MYYEQARTNMMHKINTAKNQFLILSYMLQLHRAIFREKKKTEETLRSSSRRKNNIRGHIKSYTN
jgi:hypothetical protein